jgi:cyclic pyranopterin phosphate synthase
MARLTHADDEGRAKMVDVGGKEATRRVATAEGRVRFGAEAFRLLRENRLAKGDALGVARVAAIQAGKRASEWIPLCHPVPLDHLDVSVSLDDDTMEAVVRATASARWATGVEMEALVAVAAGCLSLYDMAKAVERGITVSDIRLVEKSGGRSGHWKREGEGG